MTAVNKDQQLKLDTQENTIRAVIKDTETAHHHVFATMESPFELAPLDWSGTISGKNQGLFFETPATDQPQNPYRTFAEKNGTTGDGVFDTLVNTGGRVITHDVVGASSAALAFNQWVYAIDNFTLSLVPVAGTSSKPAGVIVQYITGTTNKVYLFSYFEQRILDMIGGNKKVLNLGHYDGTAIVAGDLRTDMPGILDFHGKFVEIFTVNDTAIVGGPVDINLDIGATPTTGGFVTLPASAIGVTTAGTAFTAANEFHEGDLLSVIASSVTAITAGEFDLYVIAETLPGH